MMIQNATSEEYIFSLSASDLVEGHLEVDTGQVHHHGHGEAVRVGVEVGSQGHHHPTVDHVPGGEVL